MGLNQLKSSSQLPEDKKLSVIYRIEPGCLGPKGNSIVSSFCDFAQAEFLSFNSDYINLSIVPRNDKTLPEMEYCAIGKRLTNSQADKYFSRLGESLDDFEYELSGKMAAVINQYMGH